MPQTPEKRESQFSRVSSIILMIAILVVAGAVGAITAMRFAIRGKEVAVRNLLGVTEEEARNTLANSNLLFRISSKRFNPKVPAGRVVEQNPPAGTYLKTDRSVKVLLSLGDRKYAVPDIVGSSLRAAQLTLAQRNFTLGNTTVTHTTKGEPSTIQQQRPQPGTQEGADPNVNIMVSLGPLEDYYLMPDLIGRPAELVASRARAEGFHVGKLNYGKYSGVESGVVIQQKPQAGNRLSKDDIILLEVNQ